MEKSERKRAVAGRLGAALVVAASALLLLWAWVPEYTFPPPDAPGPVGFWKAPLSEVERMYPRQRAGTRYIPPASFSYDGEYVTVHLDTRWAWEWYPEDFYWRLEAKWQ